MSSFKFIACYRQLPEIENHLIRHLSINQALEEGLMLQDAQLRNEEIDREDTNVILHCESEEHLYELTLKAFDLQGALKEISNKQYALALEWRYTEERAKRLLAYLKSCFKEHRSVHESMVFEVELWHIWLGEPMMPETGIKKTSIDSLCLDHIEWACQGMAYERSKCLVVTD